MLEADSQRVKVEQTEHNYNDIRTLTYENDVSYANHDREDHNALEAPPILVRHYGYRDIQYLIFMTG